MSVLTDFRDHARRLAESDHLDDCPRIHPIEGAVPVAHAWTLSCADETGHDPHEWVSERGFDWTCPGLCGGCMPDAERALWAALADEIDAYLGDDDEGRGALDV